MISWGMIQRNRQMIAVVWRHGLSFQGGRAIHEVIKGRVWPGKFKNGGEDCWYSSRYHKRGFKHKT